MHKIGIAGHAGLVSSQKKKQIQRAFQSVVL